MVVEEAMWLDVANMCVSTVTIVVNEDICSGLVFYQEEICLTKTCQMVVLVALDQEGKGPFRGLTVM